MLKISILAVARKSELSVQWIDLQHIASILAVFVTVVSLVTPVRSFPITDDWIYVRTVGDLLAGQLRMPDWAQAISLIHIFWGALISWLLGYSFASLAIANLIMSAACLLVFYLLLRQLNVEPRPALFGTAILGFNPIYVHISYSFMTDITFLMLMLLACLCLVKGFREDSLAWLAVGSVATALSYLTRQFGLLVACAACLYLLLMWRSRKLSGRMSAMMFATVVSLPLVAFIGYSVWERTQPASLGGVVVSTFLATIVQAPLDYYTDRALRVAGALSIFGLSFLPLVQMPSRRAPAMVLIASLTLLLLVSASSFGTVVPQNGNTINYSGFSMFEYEAAPLWPQQVWVVVAAIGALLISAYLAGITGLFSEWLVDRGWHMGKQPTLFICLLLGLLAWVTLFVTPIFFDRYLLPILPLLLLPPLLRKPSPDSATQRGSKVGWRWLLLVPIASFALLAQRDYMEHAAVRWQAAENLVARGVERRQISAGFEWAGWYLYREGVERLREGVEFQFPGYVSLDPEYKISDRVLPGYREIDSLPYRSWLNSGQERRVLVLKRE